MSAQNVEAARRSLEGWNRGDFDAWVGQRHHPEVEFISALATHVEGGEAVWRGVAELRRFWDEWHSLWNLSVQVAEIRDLGDRVLAIGQFRVRAKASGVELESPVAYLFEFDGDLVRRVRAYLDPDEALRTVGLLN